MKSFLSVLTALLFISCAAAAQIPDHIYRENIQSVRLYKQGNQLTFPIINLSGNEKLELHFDDLDADVKNYYYTYQLCNYDWTPANVMSMEYLSGFSQNRISDYKFSSVALTRYTHYRLLLPQPGSMPKKAGNYLLKVYLNGDTTQLAFTRRMMVVNQSAAISGNITQATTPQFFNQYQKLVFNVNLKGMQNFNHQQQLRVVLLQNNRWDNAMMNVTPTFVRGNVLEYNSESVGVFPAGKEWRWLDIRDFHLQSDRVASADYNKNSTNIYLRADKSWEGQPYMFYPDLNGMSNIQAVRGIDPSYEGDYATVYFSFYPADGKELPGREIFLYGQLTNYDLSDRYRLNYNSEKGLYETHLLLKQGYYDYTYLTQDYGRPPQTSTVDGNYYETENVYTILVYYRPFGGRADELIGVSTVNSRSDRQGFGF